MIVRELVTKLGFQLDEGPLKKAEKGISSLKTSALALTGIATAIGGGLFALVKSAANTGDHLLETSQRVGLAVESLQKLGHSASLAGIDQDDFAVSLGLLSRRLVDAREGSKEASSAFAKLKLNPKQFKTTDQVIMALADRFKELPDGFEKTALAQDLLGRAGARFIPLLNQGSEVIRAQGDELEALGAVLSGRTAKAGDEFNDQWKILTATIAGFKNQIGAELLPQMTELVQELLRWLKVNRDLIRQNLRKFLDGLVAAFKVIVSAGRQFVRVMGTVIRILGGAERATKLFIAILGILIGAKILGGIGSLVLAIFEIVKALQAVRIAALLANASALAIPLLIGAAVAAALAGIYLIIDDLIAFFQGKDSLTGRLIKWNLELSAIIRQFFIDGFSLIKDHVIAVVGFVGGYIDRIIERIKNLAKFIPGIGFLTSLLTGDSTVEITPRQETSPSATQSVPPAERITPRIEVPSVLERTTPVVQVIPQRAVSAPPLDLPLARQNIERLTEAKPATSAFGGTDVHQANDFQIQSKIEVNVQTDADPQMIGDKVKEATKSEFQRNLRWAFRSLQAGAF